MRRVFFYGCVLATLFSFAAYSHPHHRRHQHLQHGGLQSENADVNYGELLVVLDAPWRLQLRDPATDYVPLLFFFPDNRKGWPATELASLSVSQVHEKSVREIFSESATEAAKCPESCATAGITFADAYGRTLPAVDLVVPPGGAKETWQISTISDANRGWHVILRVPVRHFSLSTGPLRVELSASYRNTADKHRKLYTTKSRFTVDVDHHPLPSFSHWHSYDIHVHTASEFKDDIGLMSIRREFGGPVQMFKESAYAIGMIAKLADFKDRVLATDHNYFYSDDTTLGDGPHHVGTPAQPQRLSLRNYFVDFHGKYNPIAHREYEQMVEQYGITLAEEVSLSKQHPLPFFPMILGSHMLTYATRHFMGPFHGGKFLFLPPEHNANSIGQVLEKMAIDRNYPEGFAFAAHPFEGKASKFESRWNLSWEEEQLEIAANSEFVHRDDSGEPTNFVFKGLQIWNGKASRTASISTSNRKKTKQAMGNPESIANWNKGNPAWAELLDYSLMRWYDFIKAGLAFSFRSNPSVRFVRKIYAGGGTDAHGSFNRTSGVTARSITELPWPFRTFAPVELDDNAFAKVRTVVEGEPGSTAPKNFMDALAQGRGVVTDGPVLSFSIDSNVHFSSSRHAWQSNPSADDRDGQMGGSGRMDGGRSVLVMAGSPDIGIRYEWTNTPAFGGDLDHIEVFRTSLDHPAPIIEKRLGKQRWKTIAPYAHLSPGAKGVPQTIVSGSIRTHALQLVTEEATAVAIAGFTKESSTPPYGFRVYTNPIWILPVTVAIQDVEARSDGVWVSLAFRFPVSMQAAPLRGFASATTSSGVKVSMSPTGENGWSNCRGLTSACYNAEALLTGVREDDLSKVVFYLEHPRDYWGNELNSLAGEVRVD